MRISAHARGLRQVDPLYTFASIRTFLDILIEYFCQVTAPTLRDNSDTIHQRLTETFNAGGHLSERAPKHRTSSIPHHQNSLSWRVSALRPNYKQYERAVRPYPVAESRSSV